MCRRVLGGDDRKFQRLRHERFHRKLGTRQNLGRRTSMQARWGLLGLYVGLAGCAASNGPDNTSPPLASDGGFGGFNQGAMPGAGGTLPGTGSFPNPGGIGGASGTPIGGTSGIPQGGSSGIAGAGNAPSTG